MKLITTLNAIRAKSPCASGWTKLLIHLGKTQADDEPLDILTVLKSNGLDDALWCLQAVVGADREIRLFAVWCARQVQDYMTDQRSINAVDVAERFANGNATSEELSIARDHAGHAAVAIATRASYNVYSASNAAYASTKVGAANYAREVATAAASAHAVYRAASDAQEKKFISLFSE